MVNGLLKKPQRSTSSLENMNRSIPSLEKSTNLKKPKRSIVSGPTQYIDPNRGYYGVVAPVHPKTSLFSRFKRWCKRNLN